MNVLDRLKEKMKMKYKTGDKVELVEDISFPGNVVIPKGTIVEIVCTDRILRSYDIEYNKQIYTEFGDKDFV
jgi:hypothetical protein